MPRIRTIKPEYWVDEKIVELDPWARLLFIGLWNFADDQGFIEYSPKRIKMQIFPGDTTDVAPLLASLLESGLLAAYESPIGRVLHIQSWTRHQKVSNPASPRFDPADLRPLGHSDERDTEPSRALASPLSGKERKGKEEERKGREDTLPLAALAEPEPAPTTTTPPKKPRKPKTDDPEADPEFMTWWNAYPRSASRAEAYKAYRKARTKASAEELLDALHRFVAYEQARGTEERFLPHGATWLNGERWKDRMTAPGRPTDNTGLPGNVIALRPGIDGLALNPAASTTDRKVAAARALAAQLRALEANA